jgi:hypothetical protein
VKAATLRLRLYSIMPALCVVFLRLRLRASASLNSLLLAWLQVKGVMLHFFNGFFLQYLAFKPAKSVFERLAFLQSNFCQLTGTPKLVQDELVLYCNLAA